MTPKWCSFQSISYDDVIWWYHHMISYEAAAALPLLVGTMNRIWDHVFFKVKSHVQQNSKNISKARSGEKMISKSNPEQHFGIITRAHARGRFVSRLTSVNYSRGAIIFYILFAVSIYIKFSIILFNWCFVQLSSILFKQQVKLIKATIRKINVYLYIFSPSRVTFRDPIRFSLLSDPLLDHFR